MAGKKIEQARKTLKSVLNNLRDDDLFNIVVYDDRAESFKPELQRYGRGVRDEAERFVDNIREGGSTNIDSALKSALAMIHDTSRPSYILFLTDGLPTAGETRELSIADNCRQANPRHARIFCFGVGYDVNARLLDRLSGGNSGTSEYVKPDEDIETHVGRFYSKMTSPVLADIHLELAGIDVNRTYPRDIPDLFEGTQVVWAGRYRQSGRTTIRITGKVGGERRSLEFPAELAGASFGSSYDFVERLWAARRLGDLIDQIDMHGQNRELVDELVSLSTKYGILTPYTSFLADDRVQIHALLDNQVRAHDRLRELEEVGGKSGVAQRLDKQALMQAARAPSAEYQSLSSSIPADTPPQPGAVGGLAGLSLGTGQERSAGPAQAKSRGGGRMMAGGTGRDSRRGSGLGGGMAPPTSRPVQQPAQSFDGKVRQIGSKTFYWKNSRWMDASVTPDDEKKAIVVNQFSDEYFRLARTQKAEYNQYLSLTEPITVKLDGTVYKIEPEKQAPAR